MIQQITPEEFIDIYSIEVFDELGSRLAQAFIEQKEFYTNAPYAYMIQILNVKIQSKPTYFICETLVQKKLLENGTLQILDIGVKRMFITDEETPDELLDMYNESKHLPHIIKTEKDIYGE